MIGADFVENGAEAVGFVGGGERFFFFSFFEGEFFFLNFDLALANGADFLFVDPADEIAESFVAVGIAVVLGEFEHLALEKLEGRGGKVRLGGGGSVDELGFGGGRIFGIVEKIGDLAAFFEAMEIGLRDLEVVFGF